jgi:hypothetical protein
VLTALEKDPHKRFGSVKAFATALEQGGQSAQSHSSVLSQAPTVPHQVLQPPKMVSQMSKQTMVPSPSGVAHTPEKVAPLVQSEPPTKKRSLARRSAPASIKDTSLIARLQQGWADIETNPQQRFLSLLLLGMSLVLLAALTILRSFPLLSALHNFFITFFG